MAGQMLRVALSLLAVLALLWLAARAMRRTTVGRGSGVVEVLARQQLSRSAAVAVVRVADRALVLGVADGQVSLVTETDLEAVRAALPAPRVTREAAPVLGLLPGGGRAADGPAADGPAVDGPAAHGAAGSGRAVRAGRPAAVGTAANGRSTVLAGSALSPATWRTAVEVLRERTVRRA